MIQSVKIIEMGGECTGWNAVYTNGKTISVPNNPENRHCQQVLKWIAEGNTPEPADIPPAPTYAELRAKAYAPLAEQLDMQYHDSLNGTTTWQDHIIAIKVAYPKP